MKDDEQNDAVEYVTSDEMDSFISGLFEKPNPKCDPSWDSSVPIVNQPDNVEFASEMEVKSFISSLFKKK